MDYIAKETFYNGVLFRSKNEAKWAYFFDLIRIKYVYEPVTFTGWNQKVYKPDFYLPEYEKYAEIKSSAEGIQNEYMSAKLNGAIDYEATPVSNGLLLLGKFPFDVRTQGIRLKTKWLFWHKGVCCGDAFIQPRYAGREGVIHFTQESFDCGDPLPSSAVPDIYIDPYSSGQFMTIAINDTNNYFMQEGNNGN